jgi:hypothetical protein
VKLSEASHEALAAARAGDWERLEKALEAREVALATGAEPDVEQLKIGEEIRTEILALRLSLCQKEARLLQLELAFASASVDPGVELQG